MNKVFLSAGHYPKSPGAGFEGFFEHDEAARWCTVIQAMDLDFIQLVPTGTLKEKAQWINRRARIGDVAVEIHFNDALNAKGEHIGSGSETLYYPGSTRGLALARVVQAELAKLFPPDRGVKEGWYRGDPSRGPDYFLERVTVPALILEPEFVRNKEVIQSRRGEACGVIFAALRTEVLKEQNKGD